MFALGVGPGVDQVELENIAGSVDRVFKATSFDQLDAISYNFSSKVLGTCEKGMTVTYSL